MNKETHSLEHKLSSTEEATSYDETTPSHPQRPRWLPTTNLLKLAICVIVAIITYLITGFLGYQLQMAVVLLVLAAALWITESMPLAATSLLIALLQPLLFPGLISFRTALIPFFDPVVVLLLGGFLLAIAVEKHDLDELLGMAITRRLGTKPRWVTLGLMLTTALLSMWISNTASAALMITVAIPVINRVNDPKGNLQKIMILGVAYSATLGGFMTLIGSPPNALAAAFLFELEGIYLPFLQWSLYGLPLSLIMIIVTWFLLFWRFPTNVKTIPSIPRKHREITGVQKATFVIFLVAVALWLTEKLHPLSSSMVAVAILIVLFALGLLKKDDLKKVEWNTLILFGGGLSLGAVLQTTGLANVITIGILNLMPIVSYSGVIILLGAGTLVFSMVASNTASASIFMPIAINVASALGASSVVFAVLVAISSSIDFMLPVGTPPNAIAYSTGRVSMKDMITTGVLLNILALIITLSLALYIWPFIPIF
jgi:sodium-dependent dicarboxylate transporter 2/3/5